MLEPCSLAARIPGDPNRTMRRLPKSLANAGRRWPGFCRAKRCGPCCLIYTGSEDDSRIGTGNGLWRVRFGGQAKDTDTKAGRSGSSNRRQGWVARAGNGNPAAARPVSVGVWAAAEAVRRAERLAPSSGLRNGSVPAFQRSEQCIWTGEADDSEGTKSVNISPE